jgi:hypothetical protein
MVSTIFFISISLFIWKRTSTCNMKSQFDVSTAWDFEGRRTEDFVIEILLFLQNANEYP